MLLFEVINCGFADFKIVVIEIICEFAVKKNTGFLKI